MHYHEACSTTCSSRETSLIMLFESSREHNYISFKDFYRMGTRAKTLVLGILYILKQIYQGINQLLKSQL